MKPILILLALAASAAAQQPLTQYDYDRMADGLWIAGALDGPGGYYGGYSAPLGARHGGYCPAPYYSPVTLPTQPTYVGGYYPGYYQPTYRPTSYGYRYSYWWW
jgi:hypothetical protein